MSGPFAALYSFTAALSLLTGLCQALWASPLLEVWCWGSGPAQGWGCWGLSLAAADPGQKLLGSSHVLWWWVAALPACGDPAVSCQPSWSPGSWRREGWEAPDDPVCTTLNLGLWVQGSRLRVWPCSAGRVPFAGGCVMLWRSVTDPHLGHSKCWKLCLADQGSDLGNSYCQKVIVPKKEISPPPKHPRVRVTVHR